MGGGSSSKNKNVQEQIEQQKKTQTKSQKYEPFSEQEVQSLRTKFALLDNDKKGNITLEQFKEFIEIKTHLFRERVYQIAEQAMEEKQKDYIDFDLFLFFLVPFHPHTETQQKYEYLFKVYDVGGKCQRKLGLIEKAKESFQKALSLKQTIQEQSESNLYLSDIYIEKGEYDKAIQLQDKILQNKKNQNESLLIAETFYSKSVALRGKGKLEEALNTSKEGLKMIKSKIKIQNHHLIANHMENVAINTLQIGKVQEALSLFSQVLLIRESIFNEYIKQHPQIGDSYFYLGVCYNKIQSNQKALEFFSKSLKIKKEKGINLQDIATCLNHQANILNELGRFAESLKSYKEEYKIRKKLNQEGPQIANLLYDIAQIYKNIENLEYSLKYHFKAIFIKYKYFPQESEEVLTSISSIASTLYDLENYEEAIKYYKKELLLKEQLHTSQCIKVAITLNNIGCSYKNINKLPEAIEYHKKALELRKKLLKDTDLDIISSVESISSTYYDMQKYQEALNNYQEELQLKIKVFGYQSIKVATTYNNIACTLKNLGQTEEALKMHKQALSIKEKILGQNHLDVSTSLDNIASIIYDQGNFSQSLHIYKEVLRIRRQNFKEDNLQIAITLHNLACAYHNLKSFEEALTLQKQVLEIRKKIQGPESKDIITSLDNIASNLYDSGDYEEAIKYYEEELKLMETLEPENKSRQATTLNNIACTLHNLKRLKQSFEYHHRALQIRKQHLGETHPETVSSLNNIASNLFNVGKLEEALEMFKNVLSIRVNQQNGCKNKLVTAYDNVGSTYFSLLEFEKALENFEESYKIRVQYELGETQNSIEMIQAAKQMIQQIQPIKLLPKKQFQKQNNDDDVNCIICLEEINQGQEVRVLRCTHFFHLFCVDKWLLQKKTCPNCRQCPFQEQS